AGRHFWFGDSSSPTWERMSESYDFSSSDIAEVPAILEEHSGNESKTSDSEKLSAGLRSDAARRPKEYWENLGLFSDCQPAFVAAVLSGLREGRVDGEIPSNLAPFFVLLEKTGLVNEINLLGNLCDTLQAVLTVWRIKVGPSQVR